MNNNSNASGTTTIPEPKQQPAPAPPPPPDDPTLEKALKKIDGSTSTGGVWGQYK